MHTQKRDGSVQFAVTLTPAAATNAGKENKDTSGAATRRTRRDIFV
jgi:hypothetical protein